MAFSDQVYEGEFTIGEVKGEFGYYQGLWTFCVLGCTTLAANVQWSWIGIV